MADFFYGKYVLCACLLASEGREDENGLRLLPKPEKSSFIFLKICLYDLDVAEEIKTACWLLF